jgi:hypothetical protein
VLGLTEVSLALSYKESLIVTIALLLIALLPEVGRGVVGAIPWSPKEGPDACLICGYWPGGRGHGTPSGGGFHCGKTGNGFQM